MRRSDSRCNSECMCRSDSERKSINEPRVTSYYVLSMLQEDGEEIYTSIQKLIDVTDDLQSKLEQCEKSRDTVGASQIEQQLTEAQSKLLEQNKARQRAR